MKKKNAQHFWYSTGKWLGILLLSVAIVIVAIHFHDRLSQFRTLGLFGIFLVNLIGTATIFLSGPGIFSVIAGSSIYPPFLVAIAATLGAAFGDMLAYILGVSGGKVFLKKEHKYYQMIARLMRKFGPIIIMLLSFFPNPFFDAIGVVAGATGYSPYAFFFWIFIGRLSRNILLAYVGAQF